MTNTVDYIKRMLENETELMAEKSSEGNRIRLHQINFHLGKWAERAPEYYDAAVDAHHEEKLAACKE